MHESVMAFVAEKCPSVAGKSVLEVGSLNVNGSVRTILEPQGPETYFGIDICEGPGVDAVWDVIEYAATPFFEDPEDPASDPERPLYDFVISCEALEHCEDWKGAFKAMCGLLVPGGTLILTTRGPGFPYHNPPDHWRFDYMTIALAAQACGMIDIETHDDPQVPGVFLKARRAEIPDAIPMPQPQAAE